MTTDGTTGGAGRPIAVITGASGGIGEELAYRFVRDGKDVLLLARNEAELQRVAQAAAKAGKGTAYALGLDVTAADAAAQIDNWLAAKGYHCDELVNNAGFGAIGGVTEIPVEKQLGMVDLNIRALTELTLHFVPGMVARGRGGIMNLASTAAFQPGPFMAVYYATKAYVLSFSEGLHYELKDKGISVSAVCPGVTITGFQAAADFKKDTKITRFMPSMGPKRVARLAYRGYRANRPVVITGAMNALVARSAPYTPRAVLMPFVRWMQT